MDSDSYFAESCIQHKKDCSGFVDSNNVEAMVLPEFRHVYIYKKINGQLQ